MNAFRKAILAATCVGSLVAVAAPALAQTTLRAVMHSDLKILDPIWTTAYIVRNHGYMIYDTLLAQDEKGEIKPQMVEKYDSLGRQEDLHFHVARRPVVARRQAGDVGRLHRLHQTLGGQGLRSVRK